MSCSSSRGEDRYSSGNSLTKYHSSTEMHGVWGFTSKKASKEFINCNRELLITVIGFEVQFSSYWESIHVDLYKHVLVWIFWLTFTIVLLPKFTRWQLRSLPAQEVVCNVFPEGTYWRPPNDWTRRNSASEGPISSSWVTKQFTDMDMLHLWTLRNVPILHGTKWASALFLPWRESFYTFFHW